MKNFTYDYDGSFLNIQDDFLIFEDENGRNTTSTYLYGRCHLFALVLSEITGLKIGIFIDEEPFDIEHPVIEHVFCYLDDEKDLAVDARGIRTKNEIESEYGFNSNNLIEICDQHEIIHTWIKQKLLTNFNPKEKINLESYVRSMIQNKLLVPLSKNDEQFTVNKKASLKN